MRTYLVLIALLALSVSCAKKSNEQETIDIEQENVKKSIVGADRDSHGCITSAGYTWSILKNDCVRVFEAGTRLNPVEDNTMSAFVIFDEKGNRAELFTLTLASPIILERKQEGQPWINGSWELISWKGYVLKKDGKIVFRGQ